MSTEIDRPAATARPDRGTLAERVAAATCAVRGVARLGHGGAVEAATHHGRRRIPGVVVREHSVAVHVHLDGLPLQSVVDAVRAAVTGVLEQAAWPTRHVAVIVEDLQVDRLPLGAQSGHPPAHAGPRTASAGVR